MQIHELNVFRGQLGGGSYIAIDNGADTGKLSTEDLLLATNAEIEALGTSLNGRIDNIIAGGDAPSEAEIVDARRGAAGINYTSLGAAIRTQADDLSEHGAINICPAISGTFTPDNFTVVADGNGEYTISGTGTADGQWYRKELFSEVNAFPPGIAAGSKILISCEASRSDNLATEVRIYKGSSSTLSTDYVLAGETLLLDIPSDATGMLIGVAFKGGISFSNDTVIPFIFKDKTKFEFDEEMAEIRDSVSDVSDSVNVVENNLPRDYVTQDLQSGEGIWNKWGQLNVVSEYAYLDFAVAEGDKFKLSGYYQGGNFPAYIFLLDNTVVSFQNLDTTGGFVDVEALAPSGVNRLIVNGRPATQNPIIKKYQIVPIKAMAYDGVLVGKNDNYLYQDINAAVVNNLGSNIFIDGGVYETEVENLATDKILIGKDREICTLEKHGGSYDKPPIEIAGGIIKNLTVKMINNPDAAQYGYCVHSDNAATANKTLIISNCKFDNDLYRVIGMGVRGGETVIFENCEFVGHGETNAQAIYIHNSTGTKATVCFRNCYFKAVKECLALQAWGSDCSVDWEFIDCTCISETYGVGIETVWTDYVSGSTHDTSRLHEFSGKFTLLPTSHGNNISILNA